MVSKCHFATSLAPPDLGQGCTLGCSAVALGWGGCDRAVSQGRLQGEGEGSEWAPGDAISQTQIAGDAADDPALWGSQAHHRPGEVPYTGTDAGPGLGVGPGADLGTEDPSGGRVLSLVPKLVS